MTPPPATPRPPARRRGLTLIELMVGVVLLAVLASLAVPSMYAYIMKKRVQGTADALLVDLRLLRSLQMSENRRMTIRFSSNAQLTCYSIFEKIEGATCDCAATPACTGAGALPKVHKTVSYLRDDKVTVEPFNNAAPTLTLDINSLPESAEGLWVIVSSPQVSDAGKVRVRTNQGGRPYACSEAGHHSSYPEC